MSEPANVWFRQDLCLANNLALSTALAHHEHLILVYLLQILIDVRPSATRPLKSHQ